MTTQSTWMTEAWVQELFKGNPYIMSLAERRESSGHFQFDYVVVVRTPAGRYFYRCLQRDQFHYGSLNIGVMQMIDALPVRASVWLEGIPDPGSVKNVVNRNTSIIQDQHSREAVLAEHGAWMLEVFKQFQQIDLIGKRAKVEASPKTFMFRRNGHDANVLFTWMKEPTLERMQRRMKFEPKRWERCTGAEANECGLFFTREEVFAHFNVDKDIEYARARSLEELENSGRFSLRVLANKLGMVEAGSTWGNMDSRACALAVFNVLHPDVTLSSAASKCVICDAPATCHFDLAGHEALGKHHFCDTCGGLPRDVIVPKLRVLQVERDREERIAMGYERRQLSKEERTARAKVELNCDGCGCSLATNQVFGSGEARHCGECELKAEANNGTERTVHLKLRFVGRQQRQLPPKRSTKFDPRPGVDDQGLGFSSPTWED